MTSFDTTACDLYLLGVLAVALVALLLSLVSVATVRGARPRDVIRREP